MTGLVSLVGGVLAFIKWLLPWWEKTRQAREEGQRHRAAMKRDQLIEARLADEGRLAEQRIVDAHESGQTVNRLIHQTEADRVLVLYTENGGGLPGPDCIIFGTVLYEAGQRSLPRLTEDFQHRRLDPAYVALLAEVLTRGEPKTIFFDDMELGVLRTIYEQQGVVRAVMLPVVTVSNKVYFMLAEYADSDLAEAQFKKDALELTSKAAQLRTLLQRTAKR